MKINLQFLFDIFIKKSNKKEKKYFIFFILLSFFSSFIEIIQVFLLINFIQVLGSVNQSGISELVNLSSLTYKLLIFSFLVFISRSTISIVAGLISAETSSRFTSRIFYYYAHEYYLKTKLLKSDDLIKSCSSSRIISQGIIRPILEFLSSIILSFSILIALISKDPTVTLLLTLFILILYLIIYKFSNYYAKRYTNEIDRQTKIQYKNLNKVSNSISLLKIEDNLMQILKDTSNALRISRLLESRCVNLSTLPKFFLEFLCIFGVSVAIILFKIDKSSTFNIIAFGFIAAQKIVPLFQLAYRSIIDMKGNLFSLDLKILSEIDLKIPLQIRNKKFKTENLIQKEYSSDCFLEFRNVSYNYNLKNNDKYFSLGPINLRILSKFNYAIIGESGAGKTTFTELLLGLRPPDKGKISLKFPTDKESKLTNEGFDVENIMRDIFSYVPQKPFFFAGTILENLIYPSILDVKLNTYNKRKIYHALKIVSMDSLINKLGLDFII